MLKICVFSTRFDDMSIGSTGPEVSGSGKYIFYNPGEPGSISAIPTQESRVPRILLISHIAEMQGGFANTLVIEMEADNASRIRVAE
jgi:hypothetical protein